MSSSINQLTAQLQKTDSNYANLAGVVTRFIKDTKENHAGTSFGLIPGNDNRKYSASASAHTFNDNSGISEAQQQRNDRIFSDQKKTNQQNFEDYNNNYGDH
jgi:hypothetical protein